MLQTWKLRKEERLVDIVDPELTEYPEAELMRFIKVALFCTQGGAHQRPTMKQVVEMLSKEVHLNEKALTEPDTLQVRSSSHPRGINSSETSPAGRQKQPENPSVNSPHSNRSQSETVLLPR